MGINIYKHGIRVQNLVYLRYLWQSRQMTGGGGGCGSSGSQRIGEYPPLPLSSADGGEGAVSSRNGSLSIVCDHSVYLSEEKNHAAPREWRDTRLSTHRLHSSHPMLNRKMPDEPVFSCFFTRPAGRI